MTKIQLRLPKVESQSEWQAAREKLLVKEKELADARDALAAERRALPMVRLDKDYVFEGSKGKASLLDLFDKRRQLIVYHFWFEPGEAPCEGCTLWVSDLGHLANLHARDTSLVLVSRASSAEIETVKKRKDWTVPWFSLVGRDFSADTGYAGVAQITVFLRDGDTMFRTYVVASGRDLEALSNHWTLLDLTPRGAHPA